jgi:hypothetical protein
MKLLRLRRNVGYKNNIRHLIFGGTTQSRRRWFAGFLGALEGEQLKNEMRNKTRKTNINPGLLPK